MKNFTQSPKEIFTIITLITLLSIAAVNTIYAQDQDGDGVLQVDDLDDDNDGVLDVVEGFGYNIYSSTCVGEGSIFIFNKPALESGTALSAGAIYRFSDVVAGKDALVTIVSVTNATITSIDDDTIGIADAFQPGLTFDNVVGTPGAEFKIEIVDSGMSTPLFIKSIGGVMSDVDGVKSIRESYIVKNVSGYAFSNPTTVTASDLGGGLLQFDSDGTKQTNTLTQDSDLKVFFQNRNVYSMSITFQAIKDSTSTFSWYLTRFMSFYANECSFQTLTAPDVTITDLINFDGDGLADYLDRDSDNDGIPDLVEAGGVDTDGDGVVDSNTDTNNNGYYDVYDIFNSGVLITDSDTDGDGERNRVDLDADGDGITDLMESKGIDSDQDGLIDSYTDTDSDGYSDNVDGDVGNDNISENMSNSSLVTGADTNADGIPNSYPNANRDANGSPNFLDLDADDDGIVDNTEAQLTSGYIAAAGADTDRDGIDDNYDSIVGYGGSGAFPINNDGSGNRDFLDLNSDYDNELDAIEAHDTNGDGVVNGSDTPSANTGLFLGVDIDGDGIDDGFDNNTTFADPTNSGLTPMSHPDVDGITVERDWREITPRSATIDFDGVDDYLDTTTFINAWGESTIMAWVKLDNSFSNAAFIAGQRMFNIEITNTKAFKININVNNTTAYTVQTVPVTTNLWYHITGVFSSADSELKIYLNGNLVSQIALPAVCWLSNNSVNTDGGLSVGRYPGNNTKYFKGSIDEVRVFSGALKDSQIHQMICQEIEIVGGNIRGIVIDKDIVDNGTASKIASSTLEAYYPMTDMLANKSTDKSTFGRDIALHNIETIQDQTAPMPYVTKAGGDGNWSNNNNWLHGDVWDITGVHPDCAIVKIEDDLKTNVSHNTIGLLIDSGVKLEVNNDVGITNTWYVKLDGEIDLVGESQLIQETFSELDVTSTGSLERDQQGKGDIYSYNFWSSPVGSINATTINDACSINEVLRDGTDANNPQNITWVSGYDGAPTTPITLSSFWLFTFDNQVEEYASWQQVNQTQDVKIGLGYTMKGSGSGSTSNTQNYTYVGKPNNGDISHALTASNTSLLGNPYPSALDADQFILDNIGVIEEDGDVIGAGVTTGALYFWEHFATNNSHVLAEYHGGYSTYNLSGATMAIPDPMVSSNGTGSVLPKQYIPVGQGFFVEGGEGGIVQFNNGQRVFQKESGGNSVFTRTSETTTSTSSNVSPPRADINRLYFNITLPDGPQRQLLLAVKEGTTQGVDFGYDAKLLDVNPTDIAWSLADDTYVIQTIGELTEDLEVPLHVKSASEGIGYFSIEELQGIDPEIEIYFVDKQENIYADLREDVVAFNLDIGEFSNRYAIVFKNTETVLANEDLDEFTNNLIVFYNSSTQSIQVNNTMFFSAKNISLYTVLGQKVLSSKKEYKHVKDISVPVSVVTGTYLVRFEYNDGSMVAKKIIIK